MRSFVLKSMILGAVLLALSIAIGMATAVVQDRLSHRAQAVASVADSHAGVQQLVGPTLLLPYEERYVVEDEAAAGGAAPRRRQHVQQHQQAVLPELLSVQGKVTVTPLSRGRFRVNAYTARLVMTGYWQVPSMSELARAVPDATVRVTAAGDVLMALSEARGLRALVMKVGERELPLEPGARRIAGLPAIEGRVPEPLAAGTRVPFRVELELEGAERLGLLPIARDNRAELAADWPHPSFVGAALPAERRVDAAGFQARWQVSSIASEAPRRWRAAVEQGSDKASTDLLADAVGVKLIEPVDIYTLSDRATKYAILFVALTLGGFVLCEVLGRWPVHPVQYLLIGLAMVSFYTLLLSLSEYLGFGPAYGVAASACVGLIGYYTRHVLGGWRRAAPVTAGLALGYATLYGLIRSEDDTLLIGSLLVFAVLAGVMIGTRRVDWYRQFEPA